MPQSLRRIVVVEDETAVLDFISRNLRARDFDVLEAAHGLEALALWEQGRPDLLILDIMMPRLDGLEGCRRVREQATVPIIVLTALDAERDRVAALDLGADDYLTKPFGVEELLVLLQRVWGSAYHDETEYLRVYMGRLRRKLESDPATPRHWRTEPGVGYRFVP